MDDGSQPLTHCPICRYDLTGLPENYRCPECAFEYDASMRVWIDLPPRTWEYVQLTFMYFCIGGLGWASLFLATRVPVTLFCLLHILFFMVLLGSGLCSPRGRRRVVVSDTGMVVIHRLGRPFTGSWADLWVPDLEGKWWQRPPWVEARCRELDKPGWSRIGARWLRETSEVSVTRWNFAVYVTPERRTRSAPRAPRILPVLQRLPGKQRKAAMKAIRERWVAHAAQADQPPPPGSDSL